MYDDEDSLFRRPEIIGVLGASVVIFLGVILFILFHASGPAAPKNVAATSPTTSSTAVASAGAETSSTIGTANAESFGVSYNGDQFTCWDNPSLAEDFYYDCSLGQSPTQNNVSLYCNGDKSSPSCSTNWYPSKLQGYDLRTINNVQYLCSPATGPNTTSGDMMCAKYSGGDPDRVATANGLKCSTGTSVSCNTSYFPSELNDLTIIKAQGRQYVCESTGNGSQCFRWEGNGSPKQATHGNPDLYCDENNDCRAA